MGGLVGKGRVETSVDTACGVLNSDKDIITHGNLPGNSEDGAEGRSIDSIRHSCQLKPTLDLSNL